MVSSTDHYWRKPSDKARIEDDSNHFKRHCEWHEMMVSLHSFDLRSNGFDFFTASIILFFPNTSFNGNHHHQQRQWDTPYKSQPRTPILLLLHLHEPWSQFARHQDCWLYHWRSNIWSFACCYILRICRDLRMLSWIWNQSSYDKVLSIQNMFQLTNSIRKSFVHVNSSTLKGRIYCTRTKLFR